MELTISVENELVQQYDSAAELPEVSLIRAKVGSKAESANEISGRGFLGLPQ